MTEQVSLIEYPTDFPIKVMGLTQPGFAQAVVSIVRQHAPDYDSATIELRNSKEGKYLCLTKAQRSS